MDIRYFFSNNVIIIFWIIVAFLLLREILTWYWKQNQIVKLLEEIKEELKKKNLS